MRQLINFFGTILVVAAFIGLMAVNLAPTLIGFSIHTIISGSMEPALMTGSMIGLKTIKTSDVRLDDIICFTQADNRVPVCHRVIEVITEEGQLAGFRTKGDALEDMDSWVVAPKDVLGKVVFHLAGVGYFSGVLRTRVGFAASIVFPAVIVVVLEVRDQFRNRRARVRRAAERRKTFMTPANTFVQVGLALVCLVWLTVAGTTQERKLNSFTLSGIKYEQGRSVYQYSREIHNEGKLPLVICMLSLDGNVVISEDHFYLAPGEKKMVELEGRSDKSIIVTRGFLPTLPQDMIYSLFEWSVPLSPLASALIPASPVLIIAWLLLGGKYSNRLDHREREKQMNGRLI